LIEVNARDIEQRLSLLECPLDDKGQPLLTDTQPARKKAVVFDEPEAETAPKEDDNDAEAEVDEDDTDTCEHMTPEDHAGSHITSDNSPE
jgi:hypothetical protein